MSRARRVPGLRTKHEVARSVEQIVLKALLAADLEYLNEEGISRLARSVAAVVRESLALGEGNIKRRGGEDVNPSLPDHQVIADPKVDWDL